MSPYPLAGCRVLDLGIITAGASTTALLADLGADVIKVERPGDGDGARHLEPMVTTSDGEEASMLFEYLNWNKQSVALDLADGGDADRARRLAAEADIIVT